MGQLCTMSQGFAFLHHCGCHRIGLWRYKGYHGTGFCGRLTLLLSTVHFEADERLKFNQIILNNKFNERQYALIEK